MTNLDRVLKSNKGPSNQSFGFSSGHVQMWELDYKEGWAPKNWCFWIVVLNKTLERPLDSKEIQPVHAKGDQPWIFTGRTDGEVEATLFWSSDAYRWLIGKVPYSGKDWGQKEKSMLEDDMAGWHHRCNEHELGQTPGDGEGQGDLTCCSPWGRKDLDTTGRLNNNNNP